MILVIFFLFVTFSMYSFISLVVGKIKRYIYNQIFFEMYCLERNAIYFNILSVKCQDAEFLFIWNTFVIMRLNTVILCLIAYWYTQKRNGVC